jgi:UDP-N-acetylmuramyl pentapeptide synthase
VREHAVAQGLALVRDASAAAADSLRARVWVEHSLAGERLDAGVVEVLGEEAEVNEDEIVK